MTTSDTLSPLPDDVTHDGVGLSSRPIVDGMLWHAFHRAVTVQAPDLVRWLDRQQRVAAATGRSEHLALGRAVAAVMQTPRCDLTGHDIRVMRTALQRIRELRHRATSCSASELEDVRWKLLALGHDLRRAER